MQAVSRRNNGLRYARTRLMLVMRVTPWTFGGAFTWGVELCQTVDKSRSQFESAKGQCDVLLLLGPSALSELLPCPNQAEVVSNSRIRQMSKGLCRAHVSWELGAFMFLFVEWSPYSELVT
jgi:hypothetical protein